MADERLKQIWSGFEAVTTRKLTNRAIDNIPVPHRRDFRQEDQTLLPEGFAEPSAAAFSALRTRLTEKAKKQNAKTGRAAKSESDTELPETATFAPETDAARDLNKALKSTEFRIRRPQFDYADQIGALPPKKSLFGKTKAAADKGGKAKKKLFGLF